MLFSAIHPSASGFTYTHTTPVKYNSYFDYFGDLELIELCDFFDDREGLVRDIRGLIEDEPERVYAHVDVFGTVRYCGVSK